MAEGRKSNTDVPPDVVQPDYQCGFCLSDVTEPRALPCAHIFCTTCIKQNFNPLTSNTQCKICKREHRDIDTDTLFAVGIELVSNEEPTEKPPCDVCPEEPQPARNYCIDCGTRMCEEDTKMHDDSRKRWKKREHMTIPIERYVAMPRKYQKRLCDHHQKQLSSACKLCLALFCSQCYIRITEPCTTESGKTPHDVVPIHEIGTILKKQIGELLKLLHEKMSSGDNNVKDAWKGLSEAEDSVKDIAKVIERHEEQLIQTVRDECRRCKEEFNQHMERSTTKIEEFTSELDVMRTLLTELAVEGQLVTSTKHDVDIILLFNNLKVKVEEKLVDKTMDRTITLPEVFLNEGHHIVDADLRLSYTQVQSGAADSASIHYEDLKRKIIESGMTIRSPRESLETIVAFEGYSSATALLQRKLKEIQKQKQMVLVPIRGTVGNTSKTLLSAAETEYAAAFTRHGVRPKGTVYESFLSILKTQCEGGADMLLEMSQQQHQFKKAQDASKIEIRKQNGEAMRSIRRAEKLELDLKAERDRSETLRLKYNKLKNVY